ncbi:MAG TPA: hypothetical protein VJQ25_10665, partial [Nitrospira sp.]|nr:hypothetical protein [Nitrospira sp.]
ATLRDRHVAVNGTNIHFEFMGKSGIRHAVDVEDKRLASIIRKSRDLPGYELFQYLDESGARHTIHAADVNEYLKRIAGNEFTAKDFRTWTGTVLGHPIPVSGVSMDIAYRSKTAHRPSRGSGSPPTEEH